MQLRDWGAGGRLARAVMEDAAMRAKVVVFVSAALVAQGCGCGSSGVEDDAGVDAAIPSDAGADTSVPNDTGADGTTVHIDACVCGWDGQTSEDAGPVDPCELQEGEQTYHYVLRVIRIDRDILIDGTNFSGEVVGMDLDGVDGETCDKDDFTWKGQAGIDNNFALLVELTRDLFAMDVDEFVEEAILEGELLVVVRVEKWNGTPDDECVDVSVLAGVVPVAVYDARAYLDMDEDDLVDPGVTLDIDAESFGEGMVPVAFFEAQRVDDGRVLTDSGVLPLKIPFGGSEPADLTLHEARLRFDLGATTLANGIVAGAADVEEMYAAIMDTGTVPPAYEGFVQTILENLADLWGDGTCDHISAGFYMEGVEMVPGVVR
jgi:hypothetical protein